MSLTAEIKNAFKRRVFDESCPRIIKCLDLIPENRIWYSPNTHANSIGNLILHLEGNARQWIIGSFSAAQDKRNRSGEFIPHLNIAKADLKALLNALQTEMLPIIESLDKKALNNTYKVQVYNEKGIDILIHVIEHFSYHTGQIALLTKLIADKSLNFYNDPLE